MQISYEWLGELVDLDGLDPRVVADRLTLSGLEVEAIDELGGDLDGVVVGRIVERSQHPDADRLSVCRVDVGGDETLQIVCGAPNAREGLLAPVATVGTRLPGDFKIKKGRMRGVDSHGMLCASDELGLGDDHDGLLELDEAMQPGTPIADALGLRDTVFTLGITPNRSDAFSHYGVAVEVAALFGRSMKAPIVRAEYEEDDEPAGAVLDVGIVDPIGCPRYAAGVVRDVKVGPSPEWMQRRLRAIGQRPVNNLVDVTNYVMFEYGQPLHAFDLDKLSHATLLVRRAEPGETIESIDHVERALEPGDLVISDAERAVAIAGVMGGVDSEISDDTTNVAIEVANFAPSDVRRTSRRLGMHSDSSHRFERGVDIYGVPRAMKRALELIVATQQALGHTCRVACDSIDVVPRAIEPIEITMPADYPERILGMELTQDQITGALEALGLHVVLETLQGIGTQYRVGVPPRRPDLTRPIDLVEEVGRVVGFDALPASLPPGTPGVDVVRRDDAPIEQHRQPIQSDATLRTVERVRHALAGAGASEAVKWAMTDPSKLALFDDREPLALKNPLGVETSVMRSTLLPGLLESVAHNLARGAERVVLFELGHVFSKDTDGDRTPEPLHLTAVLTGVRDTSWASDRAVLDGRDASALVAVVARATGRPLRVVSGTPPAWAHPGVFGRVLLGETEVGRVGALHPDRLDPFEIEQGVAFFELDLGAILEIDADPGRHSGVPRTQASTRDVALLLPNEVTWARVEDVLATFRHKFLEDVRLFDVYEGPGVDEGHRSLALRSTWRKADGSLTDKQVEKGQRALVEHLTEGLDARVRT